jgi:hypothetical protein
MPRLRDCCLPGAAGERIPSRQSSTRLVERCPEPLLRSRREWAIPCDIVVSDARRHRRSRRRDRRPRRRIPCDERSATARSTVAAGSRPGPAARRRGRRVPCPARPRRLKPPLLRPNTRPPPRSARRRSPTGPSQCARARARDARSVSRERAGHLEPARRDAALVRRLLPSPRLAGGRDRGRPGAPPRAGRWHQGNPLRPTRSAVAPRRCRGA